MVGKVLGSGRQKKLAPNLPEGTDALKSSLSIVNYLSMLMRDGRKKRTILKWCKLVLKSYTATSHELSIESREDLKFLTEFVSDVVPFVHWKVKLKASIKKGEELKNEASLRIKDYWHTDTPVQIRYVRPKVTVIRQKPVNENGIAHMTLAIIEPKKMKYNSPSHGIGLLVYVAFMMIAIEESKL